LDSTVVLLHQCHNFVKALHIYRKSEIIVHFIDLQDVLTCIVTLLVSRLISETVSCSIVFMAFHGTENTVMCNHIDTDINVCSAGPVFDC